MSGPGTREWLEAEAAMLIERMRQTIGLQEFVGLLQHHLSNLGGDWCAVCGGTKYSPRCAGWDDDWDPPDGTEQLIAGLPTDVVCTDCTRQFGGSVTAEAIQAIRWGVARGPAAPAEAAPAEPAVVVEAPPAEAAPVARAALGSMDELAQGSRDAGSRCQRCGEVELRVRTAAGMAICCVTCAEAT